MTASSVDDASSSVAADVFTVRSGDDDYGTTTTGPMSPSHRRTNKIAVAEWKSLPFLRIPRQDAACTVVDLFTTSDKTTATAPPSQAVVIAGGRNAQATSLSSVELLDWNVQRRWWPMPNLQVARCGCAMVHRKQQLYVLGGVNVEGRPLDSMEQYELFNENMKEWVLLEETMSTPRMYPAAVIFGGDSELEDDHDSELKQNILVVGGRDATWQELNTCELYSFQAGEWKTDTIASMTTPRFGCAVVYLASLHAVLALGGYNGNDWTTSCELYDIANNTWTEWPSMPQAMQFCTAAIIYGGDQGDEEYVVVRGQPLHDGNTTTSTTLSPLGILQCYNVVTQEWRIFPSTSDTMGSAFTSIDSTRLLVLGGAATTSTANIVGDDHRDDDVGDDAELQATKTCRFWMANLAKLYCDRHGEKFDPIAQSERSQVGTGDYGGGSSNSLGLSSPIPRPPATLQRQRSGLALDVSEHDGNTNDEESTIHPFLYPPISSGASVASASTNATPGTRRKVENETIQDNFGVEATFTGYLSKDSGRPHGKGKMTWTLTGDFYEGRFEHGARQGKGHMRYRNGDSFVGNFVDDQREGKGRYQYRDGRIYEGNYVNDMPEDTQGTMIWKDGTKYVGPFTKAKRTGKAKITFSGGVEYEGDFVNGKYNGQGICRFADGSVYNGQWKHGKAHGYGKLTDAQGVTVHDGKWVNDGPLY